MKPQTHAGRLCFDRFDLDEADARLTCAGEPLALAPTPFAVLCTLARSPGMLVTKNALLDAVWGHRCVTESTLKSAISEVTRGARRRPEAAALHRDGIAPRVSLHRRAGGRVLAERGCSRAQRRRRTGDPALVALTALCRGDAAVADLIRAVAASLERERLVLNDR